MNIYDLKVKTRNGEYFDLGTLKGKVSLVVNTATGCGFTPLKKKEILFGILQNF